MEIYNPVTNSYEDPEKPIVLPQSYIDMADAFIDSIPERVQAVIDNPSGLLPTSLTNLDLYSQKAYDITVRQPKVIDVEAKGVDSNLILMLLLLSNRRNYY